MKTTNPDHPIRDYLKQSALALTLGAAVFFSTGPAAKAAINYDFAATDPVNPVASQQGWTKVFPTTGDLWANYGGWGWMPDNGHLGAGWEDADTILGRSPEFILDGSGNLTFQLFGSASPLAAPNVAPSAVPAVATENGGFIGVALRNVAADTYVLSRSIPANNYDTWTDLSFTQAELGVLIAANPGARYTLDFIDYSKLVGPTKGDGWIILSGASIPGVLYYPTNDNFAGAINLPGNSGTQTGTNNLHATLEVDEPATVTYPDTTTSSFNNTVWFKWTCPADGALTVRTLGSTDTTLPTPGEYDAVLGIYSGSAVNALTQLGATPQDTGPEEAMTVPVTAGTTYRIQVAGYNNAVAANILLNWNFAPTLYFADILTFGPGATISPVVANVATIAWTVPYGTNLMTLAPTFTLSTAATCDRTSGATIPSPNFSDGPVTYTVTSAGPSPIVNVYTVTATLAPPSAACDITAFGTNVAGSFAAITTTSATAGTVVWNVPNGTPVETLAPTYTLSSGATCSRISGAIPTPPLSTTTPVPYVILAEDGATTKSYAVTVVVRPSLSVTTGLKLHLDASQLTGLSDGATVTTWTDVSGSGNDATATGSAATYRTSALNGLPVVRFNADGNASFNFAGLSTIRTVFWVVKNTNPGNHFLLGHNSEYDFHSGDSTIWTGWTNDNIKNGTTKLNGAAVNGTLTALPSNSYSLLSLVTTGNVRADRLSYDRVYGGRSWAGDMAEVLIYDGALSNSEVDEVGTYLTAKYGLLTAYGPPTVVNYTPADDGTALPASNLVLTFNKPIAIGTGNITIRNTDSSPDPDVVIDVTDASQVSISGAALTINPTSDLVLDKNYAVLIDAGAIKDLSEVPFAGISDVMTWNFTIVPPVAPPTLPPVTDGMIVWLPADGVSANDSTQVRIDGADTFVKQWNDWSTNNKHASNTTPNDQPRFIASGLNGKPVLRFGQDGNGDRLKLGDLSASFPTGASVFVVATIANDGRYNLFGNRNNDERWVADTWNEARPGSFRGGRSQSATFTLSDWPQTGSHVFALESNSSKFEVLINGASIGTDSANYHSGAGSDWTIGDSAANNDQRLNGDIAEVILYNRVLSAGEADQVGAYLATKYGLTALYGPPTVLSYTPPDGGTTAATSDLVLTFNKPIAIGTGNITLKNLTNSTQTVIPIDDTQVSISGAVLTIDPMDDLVLGKDYAVQIDAGAIKALSDAPFAGILDDTTWNFATAPPTATTTMVVASVSPTIYGESVTFTATVSPIPSGGTVQFFSDVFGNLGTPMAVNTTSGEATYTTTTLGAGTHEITAEYSGNYQFTGSSTATPISQEVGQAELTVKAVDVFRPLNTANPDPLPYQITGFKNGQNLASSGVSGTPELSTTAVLASPVGDYPITCTVPPEMSADNYSFTAEDGILTVANVADTFSVNFYSFGGLNTVEQQANVLMAPGAPAGLGDWFTPGWRNVDVPWGGGLQPAVTLTSNKASTSTFLFKDCRNGWSSWGEPRTTNLGVGNYNMMGSGVNSTLDPIADPAKFDMEMTNIPFGTYDVIFYFRANQPQYGDGTGVIKFNGGADRAFKLKSGAFDGNFIEMVDATTEGNYIVFTGVTGSSFTVQTWGTGGGGFNHLGPAGFQIRRVAGPLYSTWAAANAPGQAAGEDYDNDGVENGIEYFMGETGSSFTAMPGLDATNRVTWTMSSSYDGIYEVQTSPDLVTWTNVDPKPTPSGGSLSYTLPTGLGKQFVRLLVTPTP